MLTFSTGDASIHGKASVAGRRVVEES